MGVFRIEEADRPHMVRLVIVWIVLSAISVLVALQLHYPPYDQSVQGNDQATTLRLLTVLSIPVFVGVVLMVVGVCGWAFEPASGEPVHPPRDPVVLAETYGRSGSAAR